MRGVPLQQTVNSISDFSAPTHGGNLNINKSNFGDPNFQVLADGDLGINRKKMGGERDSQFLFFQGFIN